MCEVYPIVINTLLPLESRKGQKSLCESGFPHWCLLHTILVKNYSCEMQSIRNNPYWIVYG